MEWVIVQWDLMLMGTGCLQLSQHAMATLHNQSAQQNKLPFSTAFGHHLRPVLEH
jgi:hypothetical protein